MVETLKAWKHPHARGEDLHVHINFQHYSETPPRTWGRLARSYKFSALFRNTPTHVGKTFLENFVNHASWKHPHARGEDSVRVVPDTLDTETPPRTWGRLVASTRSSKIFRNTPTHVGKTFEHTSFSFTRWKHPHARGEDNIMRFFI